MEDTRNLVDQYKTLSTEEVRARLGQCRNQLEIAIYNVEHDFNAGTIVRSANNFNAAKVHIIGRKKYNRRGAMCTDKYLEIYHWPSIEEFLSDQQSRGRQIIALENNTDLAQPLGESELPLSTTLLFGNETSGLPQALMERVDAVYYIENFGSTRSINVGVAAGIAMYMWIYQHKIKQKQKG